MMMDVNYTFTLSRDEAALLVSICQAILDNSRRIGFNKDFSTDEVYLLEAIEEALSGKKERKEVAITASPLTHREE